MIRLTLFFLLPVMFSAAAPNPEKNYFQQHVEYKITAELDVPLNRINATQVLTYTNNSPDTLSDLFFHLYLNKYREGAFDYGRVRRRTSGSIEIFQLKENDSLNVIRFVDRTLLQVALNQKLLPGKSVRLTFKFAAKLPPASGRYGYYGDHFDVGNWYPTPVVYDRNGWHLHQHLNNEFYQEWGDFRVDIRVPKGFIVGATGDLLNPAEALADTAADVRKWYRENPDDTTTTVWKYQANRVHDFAWTADPSYVLFQREWNGITLNILAMEHNAAEWKQVTEFGIDALKYLSNTFGEYPYKQVTVADTYIRAGGIEYPMITFINTYTSPLYALNHFRAVIIHEMAHNWFYGLLASNQTEDEWMDEGFTTMAEILCMEHLFGDADNYSYTMSGWLQKRLKINVNIRDFSRLQYLRMVKNGNERDQINLMPDYASGNFYISQYEKMAHVLLMLKNVLGDSVFFEGLRKYYYTWRFKHPYPEDFIRIIEETSGRELDWFFEQWLNTKRTLDYAFESISRRKFEMEDGVSHISTIKLRRAGDIFMPLDIDLVLKNGDRKKLHIPVDPKAKNTENRQVLAYWHFSQKTYTIEIKTDELVEDVILDPEQALLDVNRLNDRNGILPPQKLTFLKPLSYFPPQDRYLWESWPMLFYNDIDLFKPGLYFYGSYLDMEHRFKLFTWFKTKTMEMDVNLSYRQPISFLGNGGTFNLGGYRLDGRAGGFIGLRKSNLHGVDDRKETAASIKLEAYRMFDNRYPLVPWEKGNNQSMVLHVYNQSKNYIQRNHRLDLVLRNSIASSDYTYYSMLFYMEKTIARRYTDIAFKMRVSAGYADGDVPYEHQFRLSGSTAWDDFWQPFYRSRGSLPYPWFRNGHLYHSVFAGVRGSRFLDPYRFSGAKRLLAAAFDFRFNNPLRYSSVFIIRDLIPYTFGDIGLVWNGGIPSYRDFIKSAGFGLTYDRIGLLGRLFDIERIQLEFPIWISHPEAGKKYFKLRWILNVGMEL